MQNIALSISRANIMPEVYKITGYTGTKEGDIDKISSTEDDLKIIESYFMEAMNAIGDLMSRYDYTVSDTGIQYTFTMSLPDNWKNDMSGPLTKALGLYATNFICRQWFNLSKKAEVEYYTSMCAALETSIKKYLSERKRPTR